MKSYSVEGLTKLPLLQQQPYVHALKSQSCNVALAAHQVFCFFYYQHANTHAYAREKKAATTHRKIA